MPLICYTPRVFSESSLEIIEQANSIIEEYQADGMRVTLRQLYYRFVARNLLPNVPQSYDRLGSIINDARLAGLVDWEAIEDRTRGMESLPHWDSARDGMHAIWQQFRIDKWAENQPHRPEVWVEKEALAGIVQSVANELDVPWLACRGYLSQSEMWRCGQRFIEAIEREQQPVVLHLGDHDPSGIDMTRDNIERLELMVGSPIEVQRLALNMDQVRRYDCPPNPAKVTDSRAKQYIARFGRESWELDALEPRVLRQLIVDAVDSLRDEDRWADALAREEGEKRKIFDAIRNTKPREE